METIIVKKNPNVGDMEFAFKVQIKGIDASGFGDTEEEAFQNLVERINKELRLLNEIHLRLMERGIPAFK
jgi:hypothetical protein